MSPSQTSRARFGAPGTPITSTRSAPGVRISSTGRAEKEDWPAWYAAYMVAEQTGAELPT